MLYFFVFILLVVLITVLPKLVRRHKNKKAAKAAADLQRKRREEYRRQEEERKRKDEEIQRFLDQKERAIDRAIAAAPGSEAYRLPCQEEIANVRFLTITDFMRYSLSRFVAFDLETTGLDDGEDSIVEIAAVRVVNGVITETFQRLINPGHPIPEKASSINHITDDMVSSSPYIYEVLPAFLSFVGEDVLAAHNVRFDCRFLCQACMRNRFRAPNQYFDTMLLARYWPDAPDKKLSTLSAAAGVSQKEAHRALGDAEAVAGLILAAKAKRARSSKPSSTPADN